MHYPSVHINGDVQFDAVASAPLSFDTEVVPGAALMCAEPGAVDRNSHLFPTEEPDDQVHDFPDVFDGESSHPTMDDTVPREHQATGGEALTIFHVGFDAVVGLV